jgi:hypothetical protein
MTNSDLISTGKKINIDGGSQSLRLILSDRSMLEARQASGNGKVERVWCALIKQQTRYKLLYFNGYGSIVVENLMMTLDK